MYIDLHMHSIYSDGHNTPAELVEMAVEKQLAAISLTDHDCLDGVAEIMELGEKAGIGVLTGVELSSEFNGRDLHVLGYGVDPDNRDFQGHLRTFRDTRHKRGIKIVEKLNALGIDIEPAEVLAKAGGGTLGRPHVAQVLVDRGVVSNVGEAFDRFIAEGGPAYVPKYKMRPDEAIAYIRSAGGLAFVAHPGNFLENAQDMEDLIAHGFDGVEVFHPSHTGEKATQLAAIANREGLLISGGSDFHGFDGRHMPLGTLKIEYQVWERIKAALGRS